MLSQVLTLGLGCAALSSSSDHSEAIEFGGLCGSIVEIGVAVIVQIVLHFFVLALNDSELTWGVSIPAVLTTLALLCVFAKLCLRVFGVCFRHVFKYIITFWLIPIYNAQMQLIRPHPNRL